MRGGLHLIAHKEQSTAQPIAHASIPKQLVFSLTAAAELLVKVGDRVLLGQPLARAGNHVVHASVSGQVRRIEAGNEPAIVVDSDDLDERHPSVQPIDDFKLLAPQVLCERIAQSGIAGLGGAAFSTAVKLQAATQQQVSLLIINGAECEPFITCDDALLREHADEVVFGAQVLLHASGATQAVVAIESDKPQAIAAMAKALASIDNIRLQPIANFYPTGGERQLTKLITGNEVPSGKIPPDIGVLCQNVGTAAAIAKLIGTGQPLIERLVTVTGSVKQPRTLLARFGTPIASLIHDCGGYAGNIERLIMGGSMMGVALDSDDVAVTAATNCIVAATAEDITPRNAELPCIRCGDCEHACPAGLLPQQLLRYARLQDRAALAELGLRDCIECGCCDYVCPSQIPLTSIFIAAKPQ